MEKNIQPLIVLIAIMVLAIAIVETANYLMPVPTAGSVTIRDNIGDILHPELPFLDIVEATVERNETNLTVAIKVNEDIPNQTLFLDPESNEETTPTCTYSFNDFARLELEDNKWTPMVGHSVAKFGWLVDYADKGFPGSFTVDQKGRTIRIILDLNLLRERGVQTDVTSETFTWRVLTLYIKQTKSSTEGGTCDHSMLSYFPDYLSFHRPFIHALSVLSIIVGGAAWWLRASVWNFFTGKIEGETQPPKQVRILAVIYRLHSFCWVVPAIYFLHTGIISRGFYMGEIISAVFVSIALSLLLAWYAFLATARGILKGERRKSAFALSTLTVVFGLIAYWKFTNFGLTHMHWILITAFFLTVGITNLVCIYYLTRPQVKAFLTEKI